MADSIPVFLPETDTLSEEEENIVTTFLEDICKHYGGTYPPQFMRNPNEEDRRILAYKFLKARHWNLEKAMDMVINTTEFRQAKRADTLTLFPCAYPLRGFDEADICRTLHEPYSEELKEADICYHAMTPYYSVGCHYWDKAGHPVLYDFSGRCKVKEFIKSVSRVTPVGHQLKETILSYHLYMNLVQERVVQYADMKSLGSGGRRVLSSTVVIDAEGLHLGMIGSQIIDLVRGICEMDREYFPETLHRLLVINCPSLVMHVYGLIKSFIDVNTRQKLTFCTKAQSLDALRVVIDNDKIPKVLGGSCECPGGCIPGVDTEFEDVKHNSVPISHTVNVTIAAGKTHVVELELQEEEEGCWEFVCTKRSGGNATCIHFRASFIAQEVIEVPEDAGQEGLIELKKSLNGQGVSLRDTSAEEELKSGSMDADSDSFIAAKRGVLKLLWANQASWVNSKYLRLRVYRNCTPLGTGLSM